MKPNTSNVDRMFKNLLKKLRNPFSQQSTVIGNKTTNYYGRSGKVYLEMVKCLDKL